MEHTRLSKPRPNILEVSLMENPMVMARRLYVAEISKETGWMACDATSVSSLMRRSSRSLCTARTKRMASASNGSTTGTALKASSKMA